VDALATLDRAADDAERGAVADAGEGARVAVREDLRVARHDAGAVRTDAPIARNVFIGDAFHTFVDGALAALRVRMRRVLRRHLGAG
jgi:hypothetical protein